jgi:hypothetical protein
VTSSPSNDGGTIRPVISARRAVVCLGLLATMLVVSVPRADTAASPGRNAASAATASAPRVSSAGSARCNPHRLIRGRWPTSCWRPYKPTSPFNQPIPSGARVAADSAQIVAKLLSFGPIDNLVVGQADSPDDWSHPVYFSRRSDPVFRLHCTESWGRCPIEGSRVRVPDAARPAAGDDGHLTVITRSGWEYDLWRVESKPRGGGTLAFGWGGRTRIDGDGRRSGGTASGFGNVAGIIRAGELASGRINHALFMVARCDAGRWVYPAVKGGGSCAPGNREAAPPMGVRLQLAMSSAEIAALSVPRWKKTILRAMARYGLYLGDTGGDAWGIQLESGSSFTSFGRADPLVAFARRSGWRSGGGRYSGNVRDGVDWARYLRVIDPCVARRSC